MPNFNPPALTDRRNDVFRGYTEFFESQPGDKSQSLRLDVLDNLLRLSKDSNMNDVYLQETAEFFSHLWPKLQQNISHLIQVEERLELMREIKSSTVIQQYLHGWNTPCNSANVWAVFMSATIDELRAFRDRMAQQTLPAVPMMFNTLDEQVPLAIRVGNYYISRYR